MDGSAGQLQSYHPHVVYSLVLAALATLCAHGYSVAALARRPRERAMLYAVALGLPIYAEVLSYLLFLLRPGPGTLVGAQIALLHASLTDLALFGLVLWPTPPAPALVALALLALLSLARLLVGTWSFRRRLAGAHQLDLAARPDLARQISAVARQVGHRPPPLLVVDGDGLLACTVGALRPRIYLSQALLTWLTADELAAVICHEWAHVLRRDNLWNWLARLLRDARIVLPGSRRLWRWMIASQEEACDALAAQLTRRPLVLARALVKIAALQGRPCHRPSNVALVSAHVEPRVRQLLGAGRPAAESGWSQLGAYALAGAFLLLGVLPTLLGS